MRILVTGLNGFIGRSLYPILLKRKHTISCAVWKKNAGTHNQKGLFDRVCYFDVLNSETDFGEALENIDVVIHMASRVHVSTKSDYHTHKEFMDINFHGTRNLAEQAAQKGVKRFVFISSAGVNGKSTKGIASYTEEDAENPYNSYTISKLLAEQALRKIEADTGLEVVIIRPPLVYGPEVKANFLKLLNLVHSGLPLPLAGIKNQRSFIAVDNLVDVIAECVVHEKAGGETFLVSDGQPLSTTQLIYKLSTAMGLPSRLFYFPAPILKWIFILFKKTKHYCPLFSDERIISRKLIYSS
jgi:nucleoside-diphosphate-sugar epimerase